jgi:hypothetical protein
VLMLSAIKSAQRDSGRAENQTKICSDEYYANLAVSLDGLAIMCGNFDPDPSLIAEIKTLQKELEDGSGERRGLAINARLTSILEGIQNNLESRTFMFMPQDQAHCFENMHLMGEIFFAVFPPNSLPAATIEMVEAGSCYAAGRWIASVFHCMRVVEYGLRKLAKSVGAKISDKGKSCPVEYGTWDKVITAIRNKINATRTLSNGPRKERKLQFYSRAVDHCEYMKDIWRNEISHTRRIYTQPEALGVMNRVKDFVTMLNTHSK